MICENKFSSKIVIESYFTEEAGDVSRDEELVSSPEENSNYEEEITGYL